MGEYKLRAILGSTVARKSVTVKRYVLPKFKIDVATEKRFFLPGETVKGGIQSDYFFGKPVAGGKVTIRAATFDVAFKEFQTISGKTDGKGHFGFELGGSTREAMRAYLERHPRSGDRVHSYSLGQFGLTAEDQRERYEAYCTGFDIPRES